MRIQLQKAVQSITTLIVKVSLKCISKSNLVFGISVSDGNRFIYICTTKKGKKMFFPVVGKSIFSLNLDACRALTV